MAAAVKAIGFRLLECCCGALCWGRRVGKRGGREGSGSMLLLRVVALVLDGGDAESAVVVLSLCVVFFGCMLSNWKVESCSVRSGR